MLLDRDDLDQPVRRTPPDLRYRQPLLQLSYPNPLGRLDPDPLVTGTDQDPSIIRQK